MRRKTAIEALVMYILLGCLVFWCLKGLMLVTLSVFNIVFMVFVRGRGFLILKYQ